MEQAALAELIEQCAQAGDPDAEPTAGRASTEQFRRGQSGEEAARHALRRQFGPLIRAWIAAHPLGSDDDQEQEAIADRTFATIHESLPTAAGGADTPLTELLIWLKLVVFATLVADARDQATGTSTSAGADAWSHLAARLPDRRQQLALYLAVVAGLRPRAMTRQRPQVFPTATDAIHALWLALDSLRDADEPPDEPACVAPGTLSNDDLVAAAGGEAGRRVREHLQTCPRCAARVAAYREQLDRLRAELFRADCPAPLVLGQHAASQLPPAEADAVAHHLAGCPHCQAEAATAAGFLDTPAPEMLRLLQRLRRLVAQPLPVRAARGRRGTISLRYGAGDISLTLHPQPARRPRDHVQILGFVEQAGATLESLAGTSVRLLTRGQPIARAHLDTIGSFTLGPVAPGSYDLEVDTPGGTVVVASLPAWLEA
jgi:hypothetical protein